MLYPIAIELDENDSSCSVIVPDVPGCFSGGDTLEEAYKNAQEAILFHIQGLVDDGDEIPHPTSIENHRKNPDFADYNMIFGVVDVDLTRLLGKAEKINVTLPARLIRRIDEFVARNPEYKSRSTFLAKVATDRVFAAA